MLRPEDRVQAVVSDLQNVQLPDRRLASRLVAMRRALARRPQSSFPRALRGKAALEGGYRFLNNARVTPSQILEPHLVESAARCTKQAVVTVIHDTTEVAYPGDEREGLGRLRTKTNGYLAHLSLAVDRESRALGVLDAQTWTRTGAPRWKGNKRVSSAPSEEPRRWFQGVERSTQRLSSSVSPIHVMDREADAYALLGALCAGRHRFVIRSSHDRCLIDGHHLSDAVAGATVTAHREVIASRRRTGCTPKERKRHPARPSRVAKLLIRGAPVTLRRPTGTSSESASLAVNAVQVVEVDVPEGQSPIEWLLLTSEPIATADQLLAVVDRYRSRWVIEEYFQALKTGCALEKRQLESVDALLKALAIFIPVAWSLLLLRDIPRDRPDASATEVLTATQLAALRAVLRTECRFQLPARPTVLDAMNGIAMLGGHIPSNGPPGWQVLGRGYDDLLIYVAGWEAANGAERCDQ
jgi:Transposase DNA-binding